MGVHLDSADPSTTKARLAAPDAVGDGLRRMFDDVLAAPMPMSLVDLCDALEDAFGRNRPPATARRPNG